MAQRKFAGICRITHTHTGAVSRAAVTYKTTPDFPRPLLLESYDRKTPWFRVVPIKALGV
jgi:hypothetical protein